NASVTNGAIFAAPAETVATTRSAFPAIGAEPGKVSNQNNSGKLTFEPWALSLMKKPEEFRAYCGDGYVSAITSGAKLLASFTLTSTNKSQRTAAAAKLKASYGPANISGSSSAKNNADTSSVQTHIRYMQIGGAEGAIATTKAALDDKLAKLAEEAFKSPRFQDMRITPYAQMAEWRGNDQWRDADDEYEIIAETYWQLATLTDDIEYIIANYSNYHPKTGRNKEQLANFLDDILLLQRTIYTALSDEAADRATPPTQKSLSLFSAPLQTKLVLPNSINLELISKNPSLGQLALQLKKALPDGNAALLRINLPVPISVLPKEKNKKAISYTNEQLQAAVISTYITPLARRACRRDPTDNSCMSYAQLKKVAKLVPVNQ
ncbi:MAG: hypothetical protein OQK12_03320, partial [Motiliproteus sp.]|nr:hypothetical protein [Motiliproteus sp.]